MIKTDIATLIFLYILFSVIAIFIIWTILGYRRFKDVSSDHSQIEHVWKCSICYHIYIDSLHDDISVCPQCGSYNKRQGDTRKFEEVNK